MSKKIKKLPLITPGVILKEEFLEPMGISAEQLAKEIGIPLTYVEDIIAAKRAITPEVAGRLGKYFKVSPEMWMNMQSHYDEKLKSR